MSEIHEQATAPVAEELDDFDVEGHGLREVALGLSAASVVMGGVGAASLALDNPLPGTTSGGQAVLAGVTADADRHVDGLTGTTTSSLDRASTVLLDGTRPVVQQTATAAGGALVDATDLAAHAASLAGDVVADPMATSDRLVDGALDTTRDVRDGALTAADRTLDGAAATIDRTADRAITATGSAADFATETADAAGHTALTAAVDAYGLVDPKVDVDMDDSGTSITVEAADKSVTVSTS